jgi:hypothetical protein
MEGKILDYNKSRGEGIIRGADTARYEFTANDFLSEAEIRSGHAVDFEIEGNRAIKIYLVRNTLSNFTGAAQESISGVINKQNIEQFSESAKNIAKKSSPLTKNILELILNPIFLVVLAVPIGIFFIASLIFGGEPSERDIDIAFREIYTGQTEIESIKKLGCEKDKDNKVFVCKSEIALNDRYRGKLTRAVSLKLIKDGNRWKITVSD